MKLFKNKLILMLFATLFAICLFNSKCFATDNSVEVEIPDFSDLVDDNEFYFCCTYYSKSASKYFTSLYILSESSVIFDSDSMNTLLIGSDYRLYILKDGGWFFNDSSSVSGGYSRTYYQSSSNYFSFEFSNFDILNSNNEVVFQGASQPIVETQVVLAEIVEQQETNKVMEEILGILPIVIVVIVSLIAIRKAIAFLVTLLHRS